MGSVAVNAPKTPVTKGCNSVATATVPNVCKMPGPPAPFVPTPLPNIGRSNLSPKKYSKKVKADGDPIAIKGASFKSQGDMASKGTGGGLISSNTHGPTKFISPGSMNVKVEGKNVHLLSDMMMNNCGPSGSPANSATLMGTIHAPAVVPSGPPELVFDRADFPNKVDNIKKGMKGKKSMKLQRETNRSQIRRNRRVALKGQKKASAGRSLDEFPFASTKRIEGVKPSVKEIPVREQCSQGGTMSQFYRKHGIGDGDVFIVKIT
ncbi:MAG: DUF4150 domain-containing protein [Alphaproteobacteria bacterium]|nr:DUF4150 domain-containing protein [Alphaproteobacteria bacterium]